MSAGAAGDEPALAALAWPQVAQRVARGSLLVVPVGATEQHGHHLPLSTDTDVAVRLAFGLARRRPDVLVAPALAYGSSGEHDGFAGTLSIGQEATRLVLVELGRSASSTFSRVLFIVGHGGNAGPVNDAVTLLRSEGRDVRAWAPRFPGDAHAGRTETALMMALNPGRVRLDAAVPGPTRPLPEMLADLRSRGVAAVSPSGVLGDPAGATADEGERMLADALDDLDTVVARWTAGPS